MNFSEENILVEKCRRGESAAFGSLIKLYKRQLFSYLFKRCGDPGAAEDLFQETLIKVWRGIKNYSEKQKFSSWLFTIAHNVAIDNLRKNRGLNFITSDEPDEFHSETDPYQQMDRGETQKMIIKAVDRLSDKQREVFLLRVHGGMPFREIAELTGEPLNTVLSHMNYSIKKIKKYAGIKDAK